MGVILIHGSKTIIHWFIRDLLLFVCNNIMHTYVNISQIGKLVHCNLYLLYDPDTLGSSQLRELLSTNLFFFFTVLKYTKYKIYHINYF